MDDGSLGINLFLAIFLYLLYVIFKRASNNPIDDLEF